MAGEQRRACGRLAGRGPAPSRAAAPGPAAHRRSPALTTPGQRAAYLGYRAGSAVANALPEAVASGLAHALGAGLSVTMRGRRRMLTRHLRRVYGPDLDGLALEAKVQAAFDSYATYWLESFRLATTTPEQLDAGMSWEGVGHVDDAIAKGHGVIMALPHLGGWDFGGAWLACVEGYPATVVVESLEPPELFEWFADLRRRMGLTVVPHGPAAGPAILRALRNNEVVGLVSDRDLGRTGVEVEFFGETTTLPAGPATLALRTGAVLLTCGMYYTDDGHLGVVRPPIDTSRRGALRDDVARITQALAGELEALIRRAPEQWHLLQPNWPSDFELQ
ncbi:MAG TPA: phosphatidylinositol mannoside acyltransferase [Acidimicrobiales bacterium]|nr:phosphatidylinositol mannoside acyltransferase [Acidimicrobiales bacterium]